VTSKGTLSDEGKGGERQASPLGRLVHLTVEKTLMARKGEAGGTARKRLEKNVLVSYLEAAPIVER